MPSCKKIGAFSAFLGKTIVASALVVAINYIVILGLYDFGFRVIKALACRGYISSAMSLVLIGGI